MEIIKLERYGERGWQWTERRTIEGEAHEWRFRTDGNGEGFWSWSPVDLVWSQGKGQGQWHVPFHRHQALDFLRKRRAESDSPATHHEMTPSERAAWDYTSRDQTFSYEVDDYERPPDMQD